MAAAMGGSPEWWLEQDETMVATALAVIEDMRGK